MLQVPSDISWMVNEGRLAPVVDVVQDVADKAAVGAGNNVKGGSGGKGAGGGDHAAKSSSGNKKGPSKKDVSYEPIGWFHQIFYEIGEAKSTKLETRSFGGGMLLLL